MLKSRRMRLGTGVSLIAAGLLAMPVFAGTDSDQKECCAKHAAMSSGQQQTTRADYQPQMKRLSQVIGKEVVSKHGEDLGTIDNVAIDTTHGRAAYAIISSGGILDIGDEERALPFSLLRGSAKSERLVANVDRQTFKQGNAYTDKDRKELSDEQWGEAVHKQYGTKPYWHSTYRSTHESDETRMDQRSREGQDRRADRDRDQSVESEYDAVRSRQGHIGSIAMAEEILGKSVKDEEGKTVGELDDLMVDMQNGHIGYAVLAYGGILDMGQSKTAIPFDRLDIEGKKNDRKIVCNVSQEKLKSAPTFEGDKYPDMTSNQWNEQVNRHFQTEPYYVVYGYVITYDRGTSDFAGAETRSIQGTVKQIERNATGPGLDQPGMQVTLSVDQNTLKDLRQAAETYQAARMGQMYDREQAQQDQTHSAQDHARDATHNKDRANESARNQGQQRIQVNLAPQSFLQKKNIRLSEGDTIRVEGFVTQHGGQVCLVAKSISKGGQSVTLRDQQGKAKWSQQDRLKESSSTNRNREWNSDSREQEK